MKAAASDPVTLKDDINMVQRTLPWMKASVFGIPNGSNYTYNDGSPLKDDSYPYKVDDGDGSGMDKSTKYLLIAIVFLIVVLLILILVYRHKHRTPKVSSSPPDQELEEMKT